MLLLHALYTGETAELVNWLRTCPRKQFTTLDTHDGIGVADVQGLLTEEQIKRTQDHIFNGAKVPSKYSTPGFKDLEIYQINCTYYAVLGENDDAYLTARAVQIFAPGIPQVYYVGMLAGRNDIGLVETTQQGRDINRHSYTIEEISREVERPIVRKILNLMRFRNEFPAFDGEFKVDADGPILSIVRSSGGYTAELTADMKSLTFEIKYSGPDSERQILQL